MSRPELNLVEVYARLNSHRTFFHFLLDQYKQVSFGLSMIIAGYRRKWARRHHP
jgi:hypothetical protein